jgi:glycosyltransferase involved in cell wall biosynthesis
MIEILLATYNSEKYLREQIDSIIKQDYDNWKLLIRDGGSKDKTTNIVKEYCSKYLDKIIMLPSIGKSSARDNFSALLEYSTAPYIMFCDHDDVWFEDKVRNSLLKMQESEKIFGSNTPLLIFTDMHVVDENLKLLSASYFKYQNINPKRNALNYLLIQNVASGCTMFINRRLVDITEKIPANAVMHDHWLSLVAAAFGKIVYLNKATLYYRQHTDNVFGASKYGIKYFIARLYKGKKQLKRRFLQNVDQGAIFLDIYMSKFNPKQVEMLEDFVSVKSCSAIKAYKKLIKHRVLKTGFIRNLGIFYALL